MKKLPLILYLQDVYFVFHQIIWQISLKSVKNDLQKYQKSLFYIGEYQERKLTQQNRSIQVFKECDET